jgi:hypothetical protein
MLLNIAVTVLCTVRTVAQIPNKECCSLTIIKDLANLGCEVCLVSPTAVQLLRRDVIGICGASGTRSQSLALSLV